MPAAKKKLFEMFIIAPNCKQLKCPPKEGWLSKLWYVHVIEYYSAAGSKELQIYAATWMNLRNITPKKKIRHKRIHSA